ncbi:hypothetical protein TcYC6_0111520 [Trypanosoma cruzi]|nr:hypothetical protein TcYC6_0111520 [Trypanosoma cruzi]
MTSIITGHLQETNFGYKTAEFLSPFTKSTCLSSLFVVAAFAAVAAVYKAPIIDFGSSATGESQVFPCFLLILAEYDLTLLGNCLQWY